MRTIFFGMLACAIVLVPSAVAEHMLRSDQSVSLPKRQTKASTAYAKLPLSFVPNAGQMDKRVRYSAQAQGASFYFTGHEAVFALNKKNRPSTPRTTKVGSKSKSKILVMSLAFLGAAPKVGIRAHMPASGRVNYLIGNNPSRWRTNLPTWREVAYHQVWPGIDVRFRGDQGRLKYEFRVQPGARLSDIRLAYRGAKQLRIIRSGDLLIRTSQGSISDSRPVAYQLVNGKRVSVRSAFVVQGRNRFSFSVGSHDPGRPLVIDPGLVYSTFLGDIGQDIGEAIAVDSSGNAYVAGSTYSLMFPTKNPYQTWRGFEDTFITKLNRSGSGLVYSTYLGGRTGDEPYWSASIAVDSRGYAYVAGTTTSTDFPTTPGAYQAANGGGVYDAFVTKLSRDGSSLVYSTYLGGTGDDGAYYGDAIAINSSGNAYVTGFTDGGFPTTPGAYRPNYNGGPWDAFVTKLNSTGTALVYSTYLGGTNDDEATGIAVDCDGKAYVTGFTYSTDFPTRNAYQSANAGVANAFVTKLNSSGSNLVYSTYLGGTGFDAAGAIAVDSASRAYVTGDAGSADFPTTPGAYQTTYGGGLDDVFVAKFSSSGSSLVYSTFLGGSSDDYANNIAVDGAGQAHVVGFTNSTNYPTTPNAYNRFFSGAGHPPFMYGDVLVSKLNSRGTDLLYSTYIGGSDDDIGLGIAVDWAGKVYVTGSTNSLGYPTTPGAFDTTYNGAGPPYFYGDAFVTKLDVGARHEGGCDRNDQSDQAEQDELNRINQERSAALVPPLTLNTTSSNVSRAHGCDERAQGDVGERGSDGSMSSDRLRAAGMLFTVNAENNAVAESPIASEALSTIQSDLAGDATWRANVLNPAFTQVGIGAVYLDGVMFLTEDFTG